MGEFTSISWCDASFNPWVGCTKVGPGCEKCYAERDMDVRRHFVKWGQGEPRRVTSDANWAKPVGWNTKAIAEGRSWRVFCASLADVFDNEVDQVHRERLWKLIAETPALTWMLLTKRIGNVSGMVPRAWLHGAWPKNVWMGATVVTQAEADRDIPKLLELRGPVRWLSIEPQLEPIDLLGERYLLPSGGRGSALRFGINWVITGGESGPGARPFDPTWALDIVQACGYMRVPVHVKQMGSNPFWAGEKTVLKDKSGRDPREWPPALRVRQFPPELQIPAGLLPAPTEGR